MAGLATAGAANGYSQWGVHWARAGVQRAALVMRPSDFVPHAPDCPEGACAHLAREHVGNQYR
eukprot:scaffold5892_cov112-Isochrysis_galbana.AAC.2